MRDTIAVPRDLLEQLASTLQDVTAHSPYYPVCGLKDALRGVWTLRYLPTDKVSVFTNRQNKTRVEVPDTSTYGCHELADILERLT